MFAIGRVGWLEVGLILGIAAVPILLTLLVALIAKLHTWGQGTD